MTEEKSLFEELNAINVSDHIDKKGGRNFSLSYLSWTWAWATIKKIDPDSIREYTKFDEYDFENHQLTGRKVDYCQTTTGTYVECTVTIRGHSETETLFVMDNKNNAVIKPNQAQINKTKQRCFVKACALQGLGLYIYAGEDLPQDETQEQPSQPAPKPKLVDENQIKTLQGLVASISAITNTDQKIVASSYCKQLKISTFGDLTSNQANQLIKNMQEKIKKESEMMANA